MAEERKDNEKSIFFTILDTPGGQQVGSIFFDTLLKTWDLELAVARATKAAEENGTLTAFQIALIIDGLRFIARLIMASRKKSERC